MRDRTMDLPYLARSIAGTTLTDNRRLSDSSVGSRTRWCRRATNGATPSGFSAREALHRIAAASAL
jgi:hypothetical protein